MTSATDLDDTTHSRITALTEQGNALAEAGDLEGALRRIGTLSNSCRGLFLGGKRARGSSLLLGMCCFSKASTRKHARP